jgi:DNA polymerase-3 subunit gamma/tau
LSDSQVLALKYRPKNFDELVGQESVSRTLKYALQSGKLGTGYLFSGLRGSGKTSSARIFAKSILCERGESPNPCDQCDSCQMANRNAHIDIIEMDGASNRKIDDIRDVIDQAQYKPSIGKYKIFIIDEVHMLTKEAFNALLKTLEEPPNYVKFILATTDPLKLPPTILSRTQHFAFKRIDRELVINHLKDILQKESIEFEDDVLQIIARSGNGSLRDTLTLLQQGIVYCDGVLNLKDITQMLGLIDPAILETILDLVVKKEREELIEKVRSLHEYEAELILDEFINLLKEKLLYGELEADIVDKIFKALNSGKELLSGGADSEFVLYLSFLKMISGDEVKQVVQVIQKEVPQEEKRVTEPILEKRSEREENDTPENFFWNAILPEIINANPIGKISDEWLERCIEKHIFFESFTNDKISLRFCFDGDEKDVCKKILQLRYQNIYYISILQFSKKYSKKIKFSPITDCGRAEIEQQAPPPQQIPSYTPEVVNSEPEYVEDGEERPLESRTIEQFFTDIKEVFSNPKIGEL